MCEELTGKPYATKKSGWCIYKESIVKEADTIEDLCDEIVYENYFYHQDKPALYPDGWDIKDVAKREPNAIIYGAIWTNKGLIYVAKMNEKGELELL